MYRCIRDAELKHPVVYPGDSSIGGVPSAVVLVVSGTSLSAPLVSLSRSQIVLLSPSVLDKYPDVNASDSILRDVALQVQSHAPVDLGSRTLFYGTSATSAAVSSMYTVCGRVPLLLALTLSWCVALPGVTVP